MIANHASPAVVIAMFCRPESTVPPPVTSLLLACSGPCYFATVFQLSCAFSKTCPASPRDLRPHLQGFTVGLHWGAPLR